MLQHKNTQNVMKNLCNIYKYYKNEKLTKYFLNGAWFFSHQTLVTFAFLLKKIIDGKKIIFWNFCNLGWTRTDSNSKIRLDNQRRNHLDMPAIFLIKTISPTSCCLTNKTNVQSYVISQLTVQSSGTFGHNKFEILSNAEVSKTNHR